MSEVPHCGPARRKALGLVADANQTSLWRLHDLSTLRKGDRHGHTFGGDDASILPFVISHNLHRRHLTESQRALIAGRLANLPPNMRPGSLEPGAVTVERAAEMLNVSRETAKRGRKVLKKGVPELAEAVREQRLSINAAASIASHPPEEQRRRLSAHQERGGTDKRQKGTPKMKALPRPSRSAGRSTSDVRPAAQ